MASTAPRFFIFNAPDGDRPLFAMLLLIIGVFVLALQDSLIKYISPSTSFWQVQVIRATGNLALIISLAFMSGSLKRILPQNWRPVYFRGLVQALCMFCFFAGAPFLSIAQMAAGLYTYPLFVSLLATSCHTEYQQPDPNRTIYYEHNLTSIHGLKTTTNQANP